VPEKRQITRADVAASLAKGWRAFQAAPRCGAFFGGFYVICGLILAWITLGTGQVYWLAVAVFGFPILGPFTAVGLYEVSHRIENNDPLDWSEILGVIWRQKERQLPWISAIIIVIFLFWSFIGHMIFALFLGLSTMTNVTTSYEVYQTTNGILMLVVGTGVGAVLAGVTFAITVTGLPLLLDREIDFVTAMIVSFQSVLRNFWVMTLWGLFISVTVFAAMVPLFLGLLVVLPVLGHATWHLYHATLD
jgi:uncharacterized membrane protein